MYSLSGSVDQKRSPVGWAKAMENCGAGEILLTAIDCEGTWKGYDLALTSQVADAVTISVIAHGGAGTVDHIGEVIRQGHASAVALGSMVLYQGKELGVLVNFPDKQALRRRLSE